MCQSVTSAHEFAAPERSTRRREAMQTLGIGRRKFLLCALTIARLHALSRGSKQARARFRGRRRTPRRRCLSDWLRKKGLVRFFTIFVLTSGCTIFPCSCSVSGARGSDRKRV